jgi:hypothetical protein
MAAGRKKRSEKGAARGSAGGRAATGRKTAPMPGGKEYRQATCPVCGTAHGLDYWPRTRGFDPHKPFGVIQEVGLGRGRSFKVLGHFGPEEEPETFELVKERMLEAVREWVVKGWIKPNEIK